MTWGKPMPISPTTRAPRTGLSCSGELQALEPVPDQIEKPGMEHGQHADDHSHQDVERDLDKRIDHVVVGDGEGGDRAIVARVTTVDMAEAMTRAAKEEIS